MKNNYVYPVLALAAMMLSACGGGGGSGGSSSHTASNLPETSPLRTNFGDTQGVDSLDPNEVSPSLRRSNPHFSPQ